MKRVRHVYASWEPNFGALPRLMTAPNWSRFASPRVRFRPRLNINHLARYHGVIGPWRGEDVGGIAKVGAQLAAELPHHLAHLPASFPPPPEIGTRRSRHGSKSPRQRP